ncbi:hypothetical protein SK128_007775, partial [Halocaridina rubra]
MNNNLFWESNLTCDFCDTSFNSQDSLMQHVRLHSRRKPYKCDECDAKFSYNSTLEWHRKCHSGVMPFKCEECGAQFIQNSMLVWHKRKHNSVETSPSQAVVVNMADIYPQGLQAFPNVFSVPDVIGTTASSLPSTVPVSVCSEEPVRDISVQPDPQMNACLLVPVTSQPSTAATSSSSGILFNLLGKRKPESYQGTFRCDICCNVFSHSADLRSHMVTKHNMGENNPFYLLAKQQHSDGTIISKRKIIIAKPFKCDLCFAGFNTEGHLKSHRQKHTLERPYKCMKCGLSYSDKSILESHERRHQADRPYKCDQCGAAFFRESHLLKHIKRHTGEM